MNYWKQFATVCIHIVSLGPFRPDLWKNVFPVHFLLKNTKNLRTNQVLTKDFKV